MKTTVQVHHTSKFTAPVVAGVRVVGKDRVHWFREVCGPTGAIDIGRTNQRCIRIRDDTVSKRHCMIRLNSDGEYEIFDTRSFNGVRVCDRPGFRPYETVTHHVLEVGMFIKLGRAYLVVVGEDGKVPLWGYRLSQFARLALCAYGSVGALVRTVGFKRALARKNKDELDALQAASTEEGSQ